MLRTRLMIVGLILAIGAGVGLLIGFVLPRLASLRPSPVLLNTATVLKQVQSLSQLVTVKYVMEKVVILEDVRWYGESRVLLVAHGIVKAGVDLASLQPADLRISGQRIAITLPPASMADVYLDDSKTQVIEHRTGMLRTFDKDLQQGARKQAVDDIRRAARQSGILEDAAERARKQLEGLFLQLGFTEVEVR
jgi:hypothetical protein